MFTLILTAVLQSATVTVQIPNLTPEQCAEYANSSKIFSTVVDGGEAHVTCVHQDQNNKQQKPRKTDV